MIRENQKQLYIITNIKSYYKNQLVSNTTTTTKTPTTREDVRILGDSCFAEARKNAASAFMLLQYNNFTSYRVINKIGLVSMELTTSFLLLN